MDLLSIGEFARRSRLSPTALRRYDELGLLPPARVDPDTGYRWYQTSQLEQARLVAALRQIGMPLAQIKVVLGLGPRAAADEVARHWADAEAAHVARRDLAGHLVRRLTGGGTVMYEVAMRDMPTRRLLCLRRHVNGESGAWALGKEFVTLVRERSAPRMEGRAGAAFVIYHGEVSEDSDGPVEWCLPVTGDRAETTAATFPELTLRAEPAHQEAFVHLGNTQVTPPRWQLVWETLQAWARERGREPGDLAARVTFLAERPVTERSVPECDFAVPLR